MSSLLISFVGFELASRTGPSQVMSKKVLMVITAGDAWKCLMEVGGVLGN